MGGGGGGSVGRWTSRRQCKKTGKAGRSCRCTAPIPHREGEPTSQVRVGKAGRGRREVKIAREGSGQPETGGERKSTEKKNERGQGKNVREPKSSKERKGGEGIPGEGRKEKGGRSKMSFTLEKEIRVGTSRKKRA